MNPGFDPTEIVACAMRPAGSWAHLGSLIGFVVMAWYMLPRTIQPVDRTR